MHGTVGEKLPDRFNVCEKKMMDVTAGSQSDVGSKNSSSSSRDERRKIMLDKAEKQRSILMNNQQARLAQDLENLTVYNTNEISDLIEKGKEKVLLDRRMARPDPYAYGNRYVDPSLRMDMEPDPYTYDYKYMDPSLGMNMEPKQYSYADARFKRPPYQNQYTDSPPLMHREEMDRNGFYHPRYAMGRSQGCGDPLRSHMVKRQSHGSVSDQYMDHGMVYMDPMEPYQSNVILHHHHPSCSCYECGNKRQVSNNSRLNYNDYPDSFASHDHSQQSSKTPLKFNAPQSHMRRLDDVHSETSGRIHRRPPQVHLAYRGQRCRPLAGGAPFMTCYKCSELLMLPKKALTTNKRKKMRCGACSTVIFLEVSDKNLVVSTDFEAKDTLADVDNERKSIEEKTTLKSELYGNSGSSTTVDQQSKSINASEAEQDKESTMIAAIMAPYSAETATMYKRPRPLPVSSLQDHFEYSDKFHVANVSIKEKRTQFSEPEKDLSKKTTTPEILRNGSSATEIDLSSYEFSNGGTTFDTGEARSGGDSLKASGEQNGSNLSVDYEEDNVTINGHLIPHRLLRKAERLAGPVHPGNYWYDFRAGFWGSIGGPCLGIIPPFIQQFNYPLAENCSGGNTRVFVNGRELSEKDLNLLARRGLPVERDRSYIVEISGRILVEETGEELPSLGKLAPTIEKEKRGYGMRDPYAVLGR